VIYAAAAVALLTYGRGFARLRRRRPALAPAWAAWSFAAGVTVAAAALVSPLDGEADRSLTAHMGQHLLVGDVAPLLMAAALRGPLALFAVPAPFLRTMSRSPGVRRCLCFLLRKPVSLAVWCVVLYAWHSPLLYDAALTHPGVHAIEHASLLAASFLVWMQVMDSRRSPGGRAAFAGVVLLAGMPLAEVLLATKPIYSAYPGAADQAHAAVAMMAEQVATLGVAALLLLRSHVERVAAPAQPWRRAQRSEAQ